MSVNNCDTCIYDEGRFKGCADDEVWCAYIERYLREKKENCEWWHGESLLKTELIRLFESGTKRSTLLRIIKQSRLIDD